MLFAIAARTSAGSNGYQDHLVVESKIELSLRSRHEHRLICRRHLLLEEAHREDVHRPNLDSAHLYMGEDEEIPGVAMSGALKAHIAARMGREAAILKERRRVREARDHRPCGGGGASGSDGGSKGQTKGEGA